MTTVTDLPPRIAEKIEPIGDHWMWTGWTNDADYPYCRYEGRDQPAYRVVWLLLVGLIPDETPELDQRRIRDRQLGCRRAGHDWTDPRNVRVRPDGRRWCAECDRTNQRARYAAGREAGLTPAEARRKRPTKSAVTT